ncbi:MAG: hypothetical protein NXI09_15750 [Bacteroidetes bacterium]|nr:hypothetical protein [Bacteroidota bacterium]
MQEPNGRETAVGRQEVNPDFFDAAERSGSYEKGTNMLHEATEASIIAYEVLAQKKDAKSGSKIYHAADQQASPQVPIIRTAYDQFGNQLLRNDDSRAAWFQYHTLDFYGNVIMEPFHIEFK